MSTWATESLTVNGRSYRLPTEPTVIFTIDNIDQTPAATDERRTTDPRDQAGQ